VAPGPTGTSVRVSYTKLCRRHARGGGCIALRPQVQRRGADLTILLPPEVANEVAHKKKLREAGMRHGYQDHRAHHL